MENLKVGQKVRIKSNEWYEACKCLGLKVPEDKDTLGVYHIGQIGNIESICGDLVSVKFYDGDSDLFHKWWIEPIENQVTIQKDMETNKIILNGITLPTDTEVKVSVEDGATIITFQKQEEKEPEFKDGDMIFLTDKNKKNYIAIFESYNDKSITVHGWIDSENNVFLSDGNGFFFKKGISSIRCATEYEILKFNKEFAEQKHLKWNAEELKFDEYRWRAEHGERYWYITELGTVISSPDNYSPYDNILYKLRNYFKTEKLANQALPKLKEFFKNLKL